MTTEDTEVDRFWLIEQARNLPNTMNATKTEGFLDRLCGDNWLEEVCFRKFPSEKGFRTMEFTRWEFVAWRSSELS